MDSVIPVRSWLRWYLCGAALLCVDVLLFDELPSCNYVSHHNHTCGTVVSIQMWPSLPLYLTGANISRWDTRISEGKKTWSRGVGGNIAT